MNLKNADYMNNIQVAAYIAIGLDLIIGILSFVLNWCLGDLKYHYNTSEDTLGPFQMFSGFGRSKFLVFTIIIGFGMPLTDTISGKLKFQKMNDDRGKLSAIHFSSWAYARTYMIESNFKILLAMNFKYPWLSIFL